MCVFRLTRVCGVGIVLLIGIVLLGHQACAADAFTFDRLTDMAKALSGEEYQPADALPDIVKNLTYDQWRSIRQRPEKVYWKGDRRPFNLQFFHPGFVYDRSVRINIISSGKVHPLAIERDWFDYSGLAEAPQIPRQLGAAGFRIHYPIKSKTYLDEFLVFLGGSYLRAVGKNDKYGLSARGLAIDTARQEGEEFPWFREFWIEEPKANARTMTIYALLDSPSVAGVYRFVATPGLETVIDVSCRLFFRQQVQKVGIAPLTSMYFFGENDRRPGVNDFRPEVHDSDGLQILFGSGEWLWRPLHNPKFLQVNSFATAEIKGFGLLQRDRDYRNYEDLEAGYHERPGLWIEPLSAWGGGRVELVQIPTRDEIHDNIVAYWVPEQAVAAGERRDFSYRMRWGSGAAYQPPGAHVAATRMSVLDGGLVRKLVIDFDGERLRKLPEQTRLSANISNSEGATVRNVTVQKNPVNHSWRLSFELLIEPVSALEKVLPDTGRPIEVRAFLNHATDVVSETWSYSLNRKLNR